MSSTKKFSLAISIAILLNIGNSTHSAISFDGGLVPGAAVGNKMLSPKKEEELIFAKYIPYTPDLDTLVLVAQAQEAKEPEVDFILGQCQALDHHTTPRSAANLVDPAGWLRNYFSSIGRKINIEEIKPVLLEGTKHGPIIEEIDSQGLISYYYTPNTDYLGDDQATFLVEYEGIRIKVTILIRVLESYDEKWEDVYCPPAKWPTMIKVPKSGTGESDNGSNYSSATDGPNNKRMQTDIFTRYARENAADAERYKAGYKLR